MRRLYALFFVSGVPALLYQIVWQRALFAIYGINVESVTMVVSAFMLGLGIGGLLGGWLSTRPGIRRLVAFGLFEIGIGAFGLLSLSAFAALGEATAGVGPLRTGLFSFLLVLLPTVMMGATLPLLTAFLVGRSGNVGRSVGALYFVNTLGSATACIAAGLFVLGWLGQIGTVQLAAGLNLILGFGVLMYARRVGSGSPVARAPMNVDSGRMLSFGVALAIAAGAGFIALSYEILWFRVFAFTSGGAAPAFALLLGAYLVGIAGGSLGAARLCGRRAGDDRRALLGTMGVLVLVASGIGFLVAPLLSWTVTVTYHYAAGLVLVALAAAALGSVFPCVCHLAIPPSDQAGRGLGYLYLANIVGSSLGSLVTGFVLLDWFGLAGIASALSALGIVAGALLLASQPERRRAAAVAALSGIVALTAFGPLLTDGLYERLHYKTAYDGQRYARLVETRSGVVAVTDGGLVFGGGAYDGEFKTRMQSLEGDTNMLFRTFMLAALHPDPKQVLVIGLGSGSWARVLAAHPQVVHVTVVEINPGYLEIVAGEPEVAGVLDDPRVSIVIDDARRWLRAHPKRRFDAIVSNTTFNWRAHVTNLLSVEFLELCRSHLNPGGLLYYNTTWHPRVQRTGSSVFPHALRVGSFLAVSDTPLILDADRFRATLDAWTLDGEPGIAGAAIDELVRMLETVDRSTGRYALESGASIQRRTGALTLVTDDGMGTEWQVPRIDSVGTSR